MPGLRVPVENYEELIKRYDQSRLFLYSIRVLASSNPSAITQALASGGTRSLPEVVSLTASDSQFESELRAAQVVDLSPQTRSSWWDTTPDVPLRAQRLHRLADLDEIASFWRLPIPVHAGFPGFDLDIGDQREAARPKEAATVLSLGTFTDDPARTGTAAEFNVQGLAKHATVVGVPGSGKTLSLIHI